LTKAQEADLAAKKENKRRSSLGGGMGAAAAKAKAKAVFSGAGTVNADGVFVVAAAKKDTKDKAKDKALKAPKEKAVVAVAKGGREKRAAKFAAEADAKAQAERALAAEKDNAKRAKSSEKRKKGPLSEAEEPPAPLGPPFNLVRLAVSLALLLWVPCPVSASRKTLVLESFVCFRCWTWTAAKRGSTCR
jgi:hypothetical protein